MRWGSLLFLFGLASGCATASDDILAVPRSDGGRASDTGTAPEEETGGGPEDSATIDSAVVKDSGTAEDTSKPETSSCAGGLTACGGSCVDLAKDAANCGACGASCPSGDSCNLGVCVSPCSAPKTKCGTACVDTSTDTSNCGACGTKCATGESCTGGACVPPTITTTVTFPSTTSTTKSGTLGTGGGGKFYQTGDYVTQTYPRTASASKLTVNFKMSDNTSDYCYVGSLKWNVLVNGTVVGSYSWTGGTTPWLSGTGPDQTIAKTFTFTAPIAAVSGNFTLRVQATSTVCSGGGAWNWYPGGTATLE